MKRMELTRTECNILKGLAIVAIMLHNFCHVMPGANDGNEFYYLESTTSTFIGNIISEPKGLLSEIFAYFGHYGVAIFVFLSGYGLCRKI